MRDRLLVSKARSSATQRVAGSAEVSPPLAPRASVAPGPGVAFADLAIHAPAGPADRASAAQPNRTGLPDRLKSGVEALSGVSLDGVKVHYNSPHPARLDARAYARGGEIHLAPGQERHLAHEAWHLVQQARGRVRPTLQAKTGEAINDDDALELEADAMGAKAARYSGPATPRPPRGYAAAACRPHAGPAQRVPDFKFDPNAEAKVERDRRAAVKRLAPERRTGLEGMLVTSQHGRELDALSAHHQALIDAASARKKTLEDGKKAFMATKPSQPDMQVRIDASKQASADHASAVTAKAAAIKAKNSQPSGLKNSAALSWVDRHKAVAKAAKVADPLMRSLLKGTGLAATHERNADARNQDGTLKGLRTLVKDQGAKMASGSPLSIVGADEFQNKPDSADRGAPILPVLTKSGTGSRSDKEALQSTVGAWGEADVNRLMGKERDAVRLLHTSPSSRGVSDQKNRVKGKTPKAETVESPFYLSVDHYESAMPISPLETGYKRKRAPLYDTGKGKPNSLKQKNALEDARRRLREHISAKKATRTGRK